MCVRPRETGASPRRWVELHRIGDPAASMNHPNPGILLACLRFKVTPCCAHYRLHLHNHRLYQHHRLYLHHWNSCMHKDVSVRRNSLAVASHVLAVRPFSPTLQPLCISYILKRYATTPLYRQDVTPTLFSMDYEYA